MGQRPAETFFRIRGEERMERMPWRTRGKKDEARSLARGRERVRFGRARRWRQSRTHFANSLARCFSGLHFAISRVQRPLKPRARLTGKRDFQCYARWMETRWNRSRGDVSLATSKDEVRGKYGTISPPKNCAILAIKTFNTYLCAL